jgi:CheY-like chemotaxis protein
MSKGPETGGGIAVLVVDDEPFVRMDMAEILRRAGFHVEEASNSDEALRKLNGAGYPLGALVTDVQMPGTVNGYGLAKRVRDSFRQQSSSFRAYQDLRWRMPPNATFLAGLSSPASYVSMTLLSLNKLVNAAIIAGGRTRSRLACLGLVPGHFRSLISSCAVYRGIHNIRHLIIAVTPFEERLCAMAHPQQD